MIVAVARRAPSARSGLKQPRVQPIVRRLQQIENRRGLREILDVERARSARATRLEHAARSRSAVAAPRSCRRCPRRTAADSTPRAAPIEEQALRRLAAARPSARSATPATGAMSRSAPRDARPQRDRAPRRPDPRARSPASARPCTRLARLATAFDRETRPPARRAPRAASGARNAARHERQRAAARLPHRRRRRTARSAAGPRTSPVLPAASSPHECAKPPVGKRRVDELPERARSRRHAPQNRK